MVFYICFKDKPAVRSLGLSKENDAQFRKNMTKRRGNILLRSLSFGEGDRKTDLDRGIK